MAWGAYDRDDPFGLFAQVRELGAVHAVTLADGHEAWLVVGYDEARAALNDSGLSKDMQAALASAATFSIGAGLPVLTILTWARLRLLDAGESIPTKCASQLNRSPACSGDLLTTGTFRRRPITPAMSLKGTPIMLGLPQR